MQGRLLVSAVLSASARGTQRYRQVRHFPCTLTASLAVLGYLPLHSIHLMTQGHFWLQQQMISSCPDSEAQLCK